MIIERKPKVSLVEEIEVKEVKPSEAVLNVKMKESKKCENIIECADRKEVAEQRAKLKEQNIKHKVSKKDDKFIIECFDKIEEEKKPLKETFAGEDIIKDLIDRANSHIEEGEEPYEAIHSAIDEGLIYTKDIYDLLEHYGTIEDGQIIESYYDELYSDIAKGLGVNESLNEDVDSMSTADIEKKIENIKKGIADDEARIADYRKKQEETKDEKEKHTLDRKIETAEKKIAKDKETLASNEEKLAKSVADDNEKIRKEFTERVKKSLKDKKVSNEDIVPTEEEIKAYDDIAEFLKDNVSITIETSAEKEATLKKMLPDLEEGQYRVVRGETSGGYPMKFGISMTLHANNLEGCPEEFRDMFKDGNLTTVEEVYGILRTHFDDFKDVIGPKKKDVKQDEVKKEPEVKSEDVKQESVEVKEASNQETLKSKIESKLLSYIKKLGYDEKDFNDYFVVSVRDFTNDDGDKGTHIQIRNDLVDFYEVEESGLISELDKIVEPGYFEPYDAYVWDAYIWDFEKEEKRDLVKDLEDAIEYRKANESLEEDVDDTLIYEVDSNFVRRCEEINNAEHNETMSEMIGTYKDGCYVYFDAFDDKDGGYCQYVLYDKDGRELGFTEPLNDDEVVDEFELDDSHKLVIKVKANESLEDDIDIEVEEPTVEDEVDGEIDDEVVYFSTDEVKDVVEDVVDEIGDEMKDKEPEEVDVKEIIDNKIEEVVEEKTEEESEEGSEEEVVVDLEEATGYDLYGPKEMEPFKGPAYIIYNGGPRQIDVLTRAKNHRWVWKNIAGISDEEWYIFPSFEDALKVQKQVGGELRSWNQYAGIKDEPEEDFSDEDMSEEDAQFFENLTITNSYKNEFKDESKQQEVLDESVVIKDDLGVSEDLDDEDDLSDLIKDYSIAK